MNFKFNKEIVSRVVDEFDIAFYRSGKSRDEIFRTLVAQNPEITCSLEEWNHFSQETKDNITNRIKNSLIAM